MDRRLLAVLLGASLLGALAMWAMSPTLEGAAPPAAASAVIPAEHTIPADRPPLKQPVPGLHAQVPREVAERGILNQERVGIQRPIEMPDHDLNQTYEPDLNGMTLAVIGRRDRFVACYRDHQEQHGDLPGRFTVQVTVQGDDDAGAVDAMVVNDGGDAELQDCVQRAMADARFPAPDVAQSMVMPIPIPSASPGEGW